MAEFRCPSGRFSRRKRSGADEGLECLSKPILRPVGDALIEETLLEQVAQEVSG